MHHVRNVLAGWDEQASVEGSQSGRRSGQSGRSVQSVQRSQSEVNITTRPLYISPAPFIAFSSFPGRTSESSIPPYFRISVNLGLQKFPPPTTWQAANASLANGSHLQPAKSPKLSERPILFLLPSPSSSCIEALQGVPQLAGSSCSPTFDAQYRSACPICWEYI